VATLADRVAATLDGRQLYGTLAPPGDGGKFLVPVDDPDGLDARRRGLGLPPLAADLAEDPAGAAAAPA
jgi:hypothetical protein